MSAPDNRDWRAYLADLAQHSEPDLRPEQVDRAVFYPAGREPFTPKGDQL